MAQSLLIISRQAPWSVLAPAKPWISCWRAAPSTCRSACCFSTTACFSWPRAASRCRAAKDLSANLQALSLFGVEQVFACGASVTERGLEPATLNLDEVQVLAPAELGALIDRFDQVITL